MYSGEVSFSVIDAELANLLADVETFLAANGLDLPTADAPPPSAEPQGPVDAPPPEAVSADPVDEAVPPVDETFLPDFAPDGAMLSVGQSLAGTESVFIF